MLTPDPATLFARFETSAEEFSEVMLQLGHIVYGRQGKSTVWTWLRYACAAVLIYCLVVFVFGYLGVRQGWYSAHSFFLVLTSACVAAILTLRLLGAFQKRRLLSVLTATPWAKQVDVFANQEGLTWATADQRHFTAWHRINQVVAYKDGYLFISGVLATPVPGRAFETPDARQRFDALLARHLKTGLIN